MKHHFDTEIASEFGVTQAILLEKIYYWICQNKQRAKNFIHGKYWTYNSIASFGEYFPYLTTWQIKSSLKSLTEKGILIIGEYNQKNYDRTRWYSLSENGQSMMEKSTNQDKNSSSQADENIEPIPVNTTVNTTNNTTVSTVSEVNSPPTLKQLTDYTYENKLNVDCDKFFAYYQEKNWKTVNNKNVDWKSGLVFWHNSEKKPIEAPKKHKPIHEMSIEEKPLEPWEIRLIEEIKRDAMMKEQQNV